MTQFEFRQHTRTPLSLPVTLGIAGGDDVQATTANVSMGGFFVVLPKPPPVGTLVKFELDVGGGVVSGFGEVAWIRVRQQGLGRPAGMGVQFRTLRGDGEAVLRRVLEEGETA